MMTRTCLWSEDINKLAVDLLVYDHALKANTVLTTVLERASETEVDNLQVVTSARSIEGPRTRSYLIKVAVLADDGCILAAKLKHNGRQRVRCSLRHTSCPPLSHSIAEHNSLS